MLLKPRDYQIEAVSSIYDYFGKHSGNPVCAMPTGTGKSVVIAMFLESIFRQYLNQRVLVLTHVKELIQQNYSKLMQFWPNAPAGINSAGLGKRDMYQRIIFAGIQSVAKLAHEFGKIDLIIIDEAHLVSPSDTTRYQAFIAALKQINPMLKVIGFTATPWRLGHGHICEPGSLFTDVCFDITGLNAFNRLIAEGHLAPLVPRKTRTVLNTDGVHMQGGEFIAAELQNAVDKIEITRAALAEAMHAGEDRKKWLIFASGTHHSDSISEIMQDEFGIYCPSVHSKASGRDEAIAALKAGQVRAVVNNNILTTGLDVPDIDLILVLRPTASAVLWIQMLGRGTRPFPGKQNCLVLDYAGNTRRLGPINDPVIPRKKGQRGGDAPVRICDRCDTYLHASIKICTNCGFVFPENVKIKQIASSEDLIKGDMPITEVFKVDHITYTEHQKLGRPPAMKVTYFCAGGLQAFHEFICLQHDNYAAVKARRWWRERTDMPVPESTRDALNAAEQLKTPTHLRVWINKKPYTEIMNYCWDGTAFGTQEAQDSDPGPTVEAKSTKPAQEAWNDHISQSGVDDDIPF